MELRFEPATLWEVEEMIEVHNLAFARDREEHGFSPGYGHTPQTMAGLILTCQSYFIREKDRTIGALLYRQTGEDALCLESLCVIPSYQGKGVGHQAMQYLEQLHSRTSCWTLTTPAEAKDNQEFYRRQGFSVTGEWEDEGRRLVQMDRIPGQSADR